MEERIAKLERRMGDWEVIRNRAQRRANFWFTVLTLVVIASPFLDISTDEEVQPAHAQAAALPRLRFGRLWRAVHRTRRPSRRAPASHHSHDNPRPSR